MVFVNIVVVAYFFLNIIAEVLRTFLDLEDLHREEVLRLLEGRLWPVVAFMTGRSGMVAKYVFLRIVLLMEKRVSRKWRGGSLKKTRERLDAKLNEMVRTANWRERLRRSTNVTNWVMQGLVQTPEIAAMVAEYEARGRVSVDPLWQEIVNESQTHRVFVQQALLAEGDSEGVNILSGQHRKIGPLLGPVNTMFLTLPPGTVDTKSELVAAEAAADGQKKKKVKKVIKVVKKKKADGADGATTTDAEDAGATSGGASPEPGQQSSLDRAADGSHQQRSATPDAGAHGASPSVRPDASARAQEKAAKLAERQRKHEAMVRRRQQIIGTGSMGGGGLGSIFDN